MNERGATLVEVVLTAAIIGIIAPVMAMSITIGLQAAEGTADRVNLSHDAKLTGIYLVPDIHNAETVKPDEGTCPSAVGAPVLSLGWMDGSTAVDVTYRRADRGHELFRVVCHDGAELTDQRLEVANNLSDDVISVGCKPDCDAEGRRVYVAVPVCGRITSGPAEGTCRPNSDYSFTVDASSRTQS